jgi:hypothetical protein
VTNAVLAAAAGLSPALAAVMKKESTNLIQLPIWKMTPTTSVVLKKRILMSNTHDSEHIVHHTLLKHERASNTQYWKERRSMNKEYVSALPFPLEDPIADVTKLMDMQRRLIETVMTKSQYSMVRMLIRHAIWQLSDAKRGSFMADMVSSFNNNLGVFKSWIPSDTPEESKKYVKMNTEEVFNALKGPLSEALSNTDVSFIRTGHYQNLMSWVYTRPTNRAWELLVRMVGFLLDEDHTEQVIVRSLLDLWQHSEIVSPVWYHAFYYEHISCSKYGNNNSIGHTAL